MKSPEILPWSQRLHDAHPVAPWKLGIGLFLGLSAVFALVEVALGRPQLFLDTTPERLWLGEVRLALVLNLLVSYLVAASIHQVRAARGTLAELLPGLGLEPEEAGRLAAAPGRIERARLWRVGAFWVGVLCLAPMFAEPFGLKAWDPRIIPPEAAWHRVLVALIGWWFGRLNHLILTESRRLNGLAERLPFADLFDLRPAAPFTRQGLTHALEIAGAFACMALLLVERQDLAGPVAAGAVLGAGYAIAGLLLPLLGVRRRIQGAKRDALAWCRAELRSATGALVSGQATAGGRLADLVSYESRLAAVREWPFDASTLTRFLLYLLIPLGSWFGGALVERLVDAALR